MAITRYGLTGPLAAFDSEAEEGVVGDSDYFADRYFGPRYFNPGYFDGEFEGDPGDPGDPTGPTPLSLWFACRTRFGAVTGYSCRTRARFGSDA